MEKIGINIVGLGAESEDHSSRLYNVGEGFRNVTGTVVARATDSIYLGFTATRKYEVKVEGDIVISTETSDDMQPMDGVYGFDIDWSASAKDSVFRKGVITIVNPDAPDQVSTFTVLLGDATSVEAVFNDADACYACVNLEGADVSVVDPAIKAVLELPRDADPYTIGVTLWDTMMDKVLPALGDDAPMHDYIRRVNIITGGVTPSLMPLVDIQPHFGGFASRDELDARVDTAAFSQPFIPFAFLLGEDPNFDPSKYHTQGDILSGLDPVPLDLMSILGLDDHPLGDAIGGNTRDFTQLARTRKNDLDSIEQAVAAAVELGIDTSNVASRRDAALAKLVVMSDRFEVGGTQPVTEGEVGIIKEAFDELWSIHGELDQCVSHWHHYKGVEANHDYWVKGLADRKRKFKLAAGEEENRIATGYVEYAAAPEQTLEASKTAFAELFAAIQRGDLTAANESSKAARFFGTREHMLSALVSKGKLVVDEPEGETA